MNDVTYKAINSIDTNIGVLLSADGAEGVELRRQARTAGSSGRTRGGGRPLVKRLECLQCGIWFAINLPRQQYSDLVKFRQCIFVIQLLVVSLREALGGLMHTRIQQTSSSKRALLSGARDSHSALTVACSSSSPALGNASRSSAARTRRPAMRASTQSQTFGFRLSEYVVCTGRRFRARQLVLCLIHRVDFTHSHTVALTRMSSQRCENAARSSSVSASHCAAACLRTPAVVGASSSARMPISRSCEGCC